MVKSRDLRLVWKVLKTVISQRTDVDPKAFNLCTETNVSTQSIYLCIKPTFQKCFHETNLFSLVYYFFLFAPKKSSFFFFSFLSIYIVVVTENLVELCNMFVQLQNSCV